MAAALHADSWDLLLLHVTLRTFAADRSTSRVHTHWMLNQALQVGDAKYLGRDWHHSKLTLLE